jgi:hypothetical protein
MPLLLGGNGAFLQICEPCAFHGSFEQTDAAVQKELLLLRRTYFARAASLGLSIPASSNASPILGRTTGGGVDITGEKSGNHRRPAAGRDQGKSIVAPTLMSR